MGLFDKLKGKKETVDRSTTGHMKLWVSNR